MGLLGDLLGRVRRKPASERNQAQLFLDGELIFVQSSNVAAAQFHRDAGKMMVEFLNGSSYLYSNVTIAEAVGFANAGSKGKWVWDHLRIRGTKDGHRKPFTRLR